jgi:glycosyltransferase involved in cell wall biosynthesis
MYSVPRATHSPSPPRGFTPLQVEQREVSGGVEAIEPRAGPGGEPYTAARVLVRIHSQPLGTVDVSLPAGAEALRAAIEDGLGDAIAGHRAADGDEAAPACLAGRRAVLADPPLASVVIPTRDRPELLSRCLRTVLACEYPAERLEVVVADNAPSDSRTRELVDGSGERVRHLLAERPGSAAARNAGARAARGVIVAFVDDDAEVDRHWLAELAAGFRAAPDVACVTGLVVPAELDTPAQQLFEEYGGFVAGYRGAVLDTRSHRPEDPLFPFNPGILGSGNNVAFRRETLLALGGYDELLGNGTPARAGEDWELFLRLFRQGRTAVYRPAAIVHHGHRRGYEELRAQIRDYGVGMAAAITRTVVNEPAAALELARRVPRVAHYVLSARSPKNRSRGPDYPAGLRRAELAGLALGPFAYARSRARR